MDKVIKEIQESQWESDTWQDEDIPLDFRPNKFSGEKKKKEGRKRKRKDRIEKEERETPTSLYNLRRSVSQELKIICLTKATRGYQKHEISPRIQVKSSGNQGFQV